MMSDGIALVTGEGRDAICEWAGSLGYEGFSFPSWDGRLIHLNKASERLCR